MDGLSTEGWASAGGTTSETVGRLTEFGLLDPAGDKGHGPAAIARVRLLLGFSSIGVPLEAVAEGARSGAFDLGFIDERMPAPPALTDERHDDLVERLDLPAPTADSLREMLGTIGARARSRCAWTSSGPTA
jgi:hypothetical protein